MNSAVHKLAFKGPGDGLTLGEMLPVPRKKLKRKSWMSIMPLGVVSGLLLTAIILVCTSHSRAVDATNTASTGPARAATAAGAAVTPAGRAGAAASASALEHLDQRFQKDVQPVLVKYCYSCHGNGKSKGDVSLEKFSTLAALQADHTTLASLADVVHQASMPPEEKPQPTKAETAALQNFLRELLEFRDPGAARDPGRVTIRRLNRNEYNNTIRDLVGIDFKPATDFPGDDTGYGFDNIADVLSMSPLLAEKYFAAAEQVMEKAIPAGGGNKPKTTHYAASKMKSSNGGEVQGSAIVLSKAAAISAQHDFPMVAEYEIRVRASSDQAGPEAAKLVVKFDDEPVKAFDVKTVKDAAQVFAARATFKAGEHKVSAAFTNEFTGKSKDGKPLRRKMTIEWVEIEGPLNAAALPPPPPSELQKRLLFVMPGKGVTDEVAAWQDIRKFASRAFRRPVTTEELQRLMKLYTFGRKEGGEPGKAGGTFDFGVKQAMTAVLVSPQFLYRFEPEPAGNTASIYTISEFSLATRLSYFLWSSMPDDELYALAEQGKLRSPGVLEAQIKRMLADSKAQALVTNFAGQWLELRNLDDYEPNKEKFPKFDAKLRESMRKEPELFFANVIREDRSVLELLDADYTYVNGRLAEHYGIVGVTSEDFKKVSLTGTHRGGVLTMGAVLTVTAMPARTSPVKRGKFVLEQLMGTPPPPPPPDVPPLDNKKNAGQFASVRQRLEQHRADPTCASCHRRMDPIGFALENFDAIGAWRDKDGGFPVDATSSLPGNVKVDGPDGLRKVLLDRKADFIRCLCEKLLTYGMGRGIEAADRVMVEEVSVEAAKSDYKFSGVISAIVKSDLFQKRRAENSKG